MNRKNNLSTISVLLVLVIILFFIITLAISNYKIYKKRDFLKEYISQKEMEVNTLRDRIEEIPQEEDDFLIEKMAREQLLLKKPGENVVFVTFPKETEEVVEEKREEFKWWNPLTWKR